MGAIVATTVTAATLFAGTNVDDMVVLAVLNVSSRAGGRPRRRQIWAGQYAGIGVLTLLSLVAAYGLTLVPEGWVWLLGSIPILLGMRKLIMAIRAHFSGEQVSPAVATGMTGVLAITVANGGDNIAAYTPVFRTMSVGGLLVTLMVFAVGTALWCMVGAWLVSHHQVTRTIERWGHWIVPAVFIGIGLYIFHKAGVLGS